MVLVVVHVTVKTVGFKRPTIVPWTGLREICKVPPSAISRDPSTELPTLALSTFHISPPPLTYS